MHRTSKQHERFYEAGQLTSSAEHLGRIMEDEEVDWREIRVHSTHEASEAVSNMFVEMDCGGVAIFDSRSLELNQASLSDDESRMYELNPADYPETGVYVSAYIPSEQYRSDFVPHVRRRLEQIANAGLDTGPATIDERVIAEEDWANNWKKHYHVQHVSDTLTVAPSWEDYEPQRADETVIQLDPGMAFGTGTHATTLLTLEALQKVIQPGMHVFDVGCGSGILGIAAVKLGANHVEAFDVDPLAVKVTNENSILNGTEGQLSVRQHDLLQGIMTDSTGSQVHIVLANILAPFIVRLVPDAKRCLSGGGFFIASGIIQQKWTEVEQALVQAGFQLKEKNVRDGWVTVIAQK